MSPGGRQLLENLIDHLAWPILVAGLAIGFRGSLRNLIARIKTVKVAGVEVITAEAVTELAIDARPSTDSIGHAELPAETQRCLIALRDLTAFSPSEALTAAHDLLVSELRTLASARHGWSLQRWSPAAMAAGLIATGDLRDPDSLVGKSLPVVLNEATEMARKVTDGATISSSEALTYVDTIGVLIRRIRAAITAGPGIA